MRYLDENKRKLITDTARKHFKRHGFKDASMAKIASESNLAVGTLYLYFPNKAELLRCTVEDFVEEHQKLIQKIIKSKKSASLKLRQYLRERFEAVDAIRSKENLDSELNEKIFELFPSRREEESAMMINTISQIMEFAIASGEFKKLTNVDDDLFVFMHSISWFFLSTDAHKDNEPKARDLDKVICWFINKWT